MFWQLKESTITVYPLLWVNSTFEITLFIQAAFNNAESHPTVYKPALGADVCLSLIKLMANFLIQFLISLNFAGE